MISISMWIISRIGLLVSLRFDRRTVSFKIWVFLFITFMRMFAFKCDI